MKEDETTHRVKRLSFNYALHTMRKFKNSIQKTVELRPDLLSVCPCDNTSEIDTKAY